MKKTLKTFTPSFFLLNAAILTIHGILYYHFHNSYHFFLSPSLFHAMPHSPHDIVPLQEDDGSKRKSLPMELQNEENENETCVPSLGRTPELSRSVGSSFYENLKTTDDASVVYELISNEDEEINKTQGYEIPLQDDSEKDASSWLDRIMQSYIFTHFDKILLSILFLRLLPNPYKGKTVNITIYVDC